MRKSTGNLATNASSDMISARIRPRSAAAPWEQVQPFGLVPGVAQRHSVLFEQRVAFRRWKVAAFKFAIIARIEPVSEDGISRSDSPVLISKTLSAWLKTRFGITTSRRNHRSAKAIWLPSPVVIIVPHLQRCVKRYTGSWSSESRQTSPAAALRGRPSHCWQERTMPAASRPRSARSSVRGPCSMNLIGDAEPVNVDCVQAGVGGRFEHRAAEPTHQYAFFHRHHQRHVGDRGQDRRRVQRFDEPGVDHARDRAPSAASRLAASRRGAASSRRPSGTRPCP